MGAIANYPEPSDLNGVGLLGDRAGVTVLVDRDDLVGAKPITNTSGAGVAWRIRGSDLSADSTDFTISGNVFAGVNLPGSATPNTVFNVGINTDANGGRIDTSKPSLRIGFEQNYWQGGIGPQAMEFHCPSMFTTAGVEKRPFSVYMPWDGGDGSQATLQIDLFTMHDYAYAPKVNWNLKGNYADFVTAFKLRALQNNYSFFEQRNAANSAYLPLPFFDADDRLRNNNSFVSVGATPTAGTYANQFAVLQPTSLPVGGHALVIEIPNVAGAAKALTMQGSVAGSLDSNLFNNDNNSGSHARNVLRVIGAGGGDAYTSLIVNAVTTWSYGLDNSDSDSYVWSQGAALGTGNQMKLTTSGKLTIAGGLGVGNSASASAVGTLSRKMEVFDASGSSIGFVPIYTTIT